jgi:hypothetical protein
MCRALIRFRLISRKKVRMQMTVANVPKDDIFQSAIAEYVVVKPQQAS